MVQLSTDLSTIIRDTDEACRELAGDTLVGLDLETGGLNPWRSGIAVVSLYGAQSGRTAVLHVRGRIPERLKAFIEDENRMFIAHNGYSFDMLFLGNEGVDVGKARWYDTRIGAQTVIATMRHDVSKSLAAEVSRRLGKELKKGIDHGSWFNPVLNDEQVAYCAGDIIYLPRLKEEQEKLAEEKGTADALAFEQSIVPIVVGMSLRGLPMSPSVFTKWLAGFANRRDGLMDTLHAELGPINLNSVPQLLKALQEKGYELRDTKKETLELIHKYGGDSGELIGDILEYRFATKRVTSYTPEWIQAHIHGGWLHSRLHPLGADTGRFSSTEPNIQQLPKDRGSGDRPYVGNLEGYKIVAADYSGIEVRMIAHLAKDQALIDLFSASDMHTEVARDLFGVPFDQVTKPQRQIAKGATFTLTFAGGYGKIQQYARVNGVQMSKIEAQRIYNRFFARFHRVAALKEAAQYRAARGGACVITLPTGLRRVLAGDQLRATTLLNTKAQGSAAAGMKCALLEAHRRGLTKYLGATVHDELVAAVPEGEAEEYAAELKEAMIAGMYEVVDKNIPIAVEASIGDWWRH